MRKIIFDIEGDSLNPTKIHCLSWFDGNITQSTTDYDVMRNVLLGSDILIGHNIILWDIPHIERILGINIKGQLIDTLALSWYIYPKRTKHGLESWGEALGFKKPKIDDWENQNIEDYIFRCESDVEINKRVWERFSRYLNDLYENNEDKEKLLKYLSFKLSCIALQEKSKWKLNVSKCKKHLDELLDKKGPIVQKLKELMPLVPQTATIKKPKNYYKANLEISARALKWEEIEQHGDIVEYGEDYMIYIKDYMEPNPNSHIQIKDWLFSCGWKPQNFKYEVNKDTGEKREIPQVKVDGELCPSVFKLAENEPRVKLLEDLTVLSHRINILKGFLRDQKNGYLQATIGGLTNTLRFKHRELVNLPGVRRPYGEYIRGVLIAEDGYELCGSDMASLEDRTKQHYMWTHDPEYVKEMQTPDFDPHLALAEFAGALTPEQVKAHKEGVENHGSTRYLYKTANYALSRRM